MRLFSLPTLQIRTPGYSEQRRALVIGAPAALACILSSQSALVAAMDATSSDIALQRFLDESLDRALQLKSDASAGGQDEYVTFLESAVTTIRNVSAEPLSQTSWKGFDPGVFLGNSGRNRAFFIVQWRLAPGAFLPPHCHPRTSVCTLGLEGSSTLRHFEVPADAPSYRDDRSTEFLVRETRQLDLTSGTTSTLTEHRDNVHLFEAGPDGARGIDVTTDYGGDGSFSFLEFDHRRPEIPAERAYRARWVGTNI